jgi:hypothetical protein
MNCILYPGETGIVAFTSEADRPEVNPDLPKDEILSDHPPQQGTRLIDYQAFFRRWKDLKQQYPFDQEYYGYPEDLYEGYHPAAENLSFRIEGARIIVEFGVDVDLPSFGGHFTASWMVLYDIQGKIINILFSDPTYCMGVGCFDSRMYHLFGVGSNSHVARDPTISPNVYTDWWKPIIEMTEEQLQQVDHIRVLNELQNYSMCIDPLSP